MENNFWKDFSFSDVANNIETGKDLNLKRIMWNHNAYLLVHVKSFKYYILKLSSLVSVFLVYYKFYKGNCEYSLNIWIFNQLLVLKYLNQKDSTNVWNMCMEIWKSMKLWKKKRRENGTNLNLRRMIRGKIKKNTWNKSRGASNNLSTKHYHLSTM